MILSFYKYHGTGNDFILIDDRTCSFPINGSLISHLCHRNYGIGADGLITLQSSPLADGAMRIFNSDGKEASMCGNGLRCAAHFLSTLKGGQNKLSIASDKKIHHCSICDNIVTATLGAPKISPTSLNLTLDNTPIECFFIDTGVPHLVVITSNIESDDFTEKAQKLRFHPRFAPDGVNVNFAEKLGEPRPEGRGFLPLDKENWKIRTYERGVERETLACGTGSAALACVAWHLNSTKHKFNVHCLSTDILQFDLFTTDSLLDDIQMRGSIAPVFQGKIATETLTPHNYERFSLYSRPQKTRQSTYSTRLD